MTMAAGSKRTKKRRREVEEAKNTFGPRRGDETKDRGSALSGSDWLIRPTIFIITQSIQTWIKREEEPLKLIVGRVIRGPPKYLFGWRTLRFVHF